MILSFLKTPLSHLARPITVHKVIYIVEPSIFFILLDFDVDIPWPPSATGVFSSIPIITTHEWAEWFKKTDQTVTCKHRLVYPDLLISDAYTSSFSDSHCLDPVWGGIKDPVIWQFVSVSTLQLTIRRHTIN